MRVDVRTLSTNRICVHEKGNIDKNFLKKHSMKYTSTENIIVIKYFINFIRSYLSTKDSIERKQPVLMSTYRFVDHCFLEAEYA